MSRGTTKKREAVKVAAKWEAELQEGRYKVPSKIGWDEFCDRYEDQVLSGKADATSQKWSVVRNQIRQLRPITRLSQITPEWVSLFQSELR